MENPGVQYSRIYRLQFLRCVPTVVKASSVMRLEIICCSEFNDPVIHVGENESSLNLLVSIRRHGDLISCVPTEESRLSPQKTNLLPQTGATSVHVIAPRTAGFYSIYIECLSENRSCFILPISSENFKVCEREEYNEKYQGKNVPKLLCCYRSFKYLDSKLLIREEYGLTLGSHIYDSSIILLKYMQDNLPHIQSYFMNGWTSTVTRDIPVRILELGAGCGLVGIWLSTVLAKHKWEIDSRCIGDDSTNHNNYCVPCVYLTDKKSQLSLLQHNIQINSRHTAEYRQQVHISCAPLDWADAAEVGAYRSNSGPPTLIVAGDVFYDREVASLFFDTVRTLGEPGVTKVLVAQKLRAGRAGIPVALISESEIRNTRGFECITAVHNEADVILWSLMCTT